MQVFNRNVSVRELTVFGFEVVLISGSMALAATLRADAAAPDVTIWKIAIVTALCQLCFYYNDLYDLTVVQSRRELVIRLLQATGAAAMVLAVACVAVPSMILDAGTFVTALGVFVIAVLTWRAVFSHVARAPRLEDRVVIVGTGSTARMLAQQIGTQHDFEEPLSSARSPDADRAQAPAGSTPSRPSHDARSSSSPCTAFVTAFVNLTSRWIACTRSVDAFRSAVAFSFPTRRSSWRIGSAK